MQVQTLGAMESQLLHKQIEDLRNRTKPRPHKTEKVISQLRDEDIEILNSEPDRQTVVVWIWCRSQVAIEHIQSLYESNQLRDILFGLANIQPSISMVINIDGNQFKKTFVTRPISINLAKRITLRGAEYMLGVTKLRNKIYVLCRSYSSDPHINAILVYQDRKPFRLQKKIKITGCGSPIDIGSSEKENCLYVADSVEFCVWKITMETDDQHKDIKWLDTDYQPITLSVSNDGQLLIFNSSSRMLIIYGSDAELIRSIQLPKDIENPVHAVETSIGNFIIIHGLMESEEGERGSSVKGWVTNWGICELTRDGQVLVTIRRFSDSSETQKLNNPIYLSLDSDDRVFVADAGIRRVILLDSDLKWNRILCPTEETDETKTEEPWRLCYDQEKKQLIIGGFLGDVNVYTLSRK